MLMYLATNSRPEITYAVHQCARFIHNYFKSHDVIIKCVLRYLKRTSNRGMDVHLTGKYNVDCYVDADFAGIWSIEDNRDPICVKSRTGCISMFINSPILWVSKFQTQVALSTMESDYITLSHSMRELIGL